jgi:hypothetical protein
MPSVSPARRPRGADAADHRQAQLPPQVLLRALDEAFHGPAWHGPALKVTLHHCTPAEAQRRLAPGRNTVWELALHAAYGKHILRVRLTGDRRRFRRPLTTPWWPKVVDPSPDGWREDLALLDASHAELVESLGDVTPQQLGRRRPGKRHTIGEELIGLVLHDTYHAGQIALIRKLASA